MSHRAASLKHSELVVDTDAVGHPVSPRLFGLFFEDINFGLDGGLNANLIANHSFEAVSLDRRGHSFLLGAVLLHKKPRRLFDRAIHWMIDGGELEVRAEGAIVGNGHYARVSVAAEAVLANNGYPGDRPGIGARAGVPLNFSALMRTGSFTGSVAVRLVDADGAVLAVSEATMSDDDSWQTATATLLPSRWALTTLQIVLTGHGRVDLDEVSLIPADHWGAGDPRWSQGLFRRDLVDAIAAVNPTFLRFPGGCIVEGLDAENTYNWKKTIGPLALRQGDFNLWALVRPRGDYFQSQQIGFYEFFLLCEDLGIEPIPVVNGGLYCQNMAKGALAVDGTEFAKLTQDILDLIDWATGDPATNEWARQRAEAGHPEPFTLTTIGIGNENHGAIYHERFDLLRAAAQKHAPGLDVILSGSPGHSGRKYDETWKHARTDTSGLIVDEHFYASQKWFRASARRYDDYDRAGARVFVGEYAAQFPNITTAPKRRAPANTYASALAEAVFYTGIIRNSDIVVMSSYAPLFNLVDEGQWSHNFIDYNPFTVQPTVNYEMQKLFTDALGDCTLNLPDLPDGVFGSATRNDHEAFVHLVNTTSKTITMTVSVPRADSLTGSYVAENPGYRHDLQFGIPTREFLSLRPSGIDVTGSTNQLTLQPGAVTVLTARLAG